MAFFSVLRSSPIAVPAAVAAAASSCRRPPFSCSSGHAASVLRITSSKRRASFRAATSLSVRCEQSANPGGGGGGADVWVGRLAMVSVTAAFTTELSTGKGLLENLGVATPAPALALVVTALVVGLAVLFISQSGSGSRA